MATDVLAVLDELGLERVKLVGHDWGGWIGFLLCLRAPQRFERYLALNILPPWTSMRAMAPHLWRFWYQWLILAPGIGYRAAPQRHVRAESPGRRLGAARGLGRRRRSTPSPTTFTEPARARAAVQMYRVFNLREVPAICRGRYAARAAHACRPGCCSAPTTPPCHARPPRRLRAPRRRDADRARPRLRPLHRRRAARAGRRASPRVLRA